MVFGPLLWPSCDFKFIFGLKEDSGLVQGVLKDLLCFHMQKLQLFLRASADRPSESMDGIWPSPPPPPELYQKSVHRAKRAVWNLTLFR